jgi:hypothetical protein
MWRAHPFIGFSVGLVLTCLVASPSADAAKRLPCSKKGSRTVAQTARARVIEVRSKEHEGYDVLGCLHRLDRFVFLGFNDRGFDEPEPEIVEQVRLKGSLVGYGRSSFTKRDEEYEIYVTDLSTGRARRSFPSAWRGQQAKDICARTSSSCYGDGWPTDLVLKANGAVAWIVETHYATEDRPSCGSKSPCFHVYKASAKSKMKLIDGGATIDPESLVRSGSKIYWRNGEQIRSAGLY